MPGWIRALLWILVIWIACYMMNIDLMSLLAGIAHAIQQAHQTTRGISHG